MGEIIKFIRRRRQRRVPQPGMVSGRHWAMVADWHRGRGLWCRRRGAAATPDVRLLLLDKGKHQFVRRTYPPRAGTKRLPLYDHQPLEGRALVLHRGIRPSGRLAQGTNLTSLRTAHSKRAEATATRNRRHHGTA